MTGCVQFLAQYFDSATGFSRLQYVRLLKRNRNYIVITNNCVLKLIVSNYDVGMQAGIVDHCKGERDKQAASMCLIIP